MSGLKLRLFGSPQVEVDGTAVEISRHKALAILAYLAVTGERQSRDKLAAMFWPESSQSRARSSLRRDLSTLNKALDRRWLTTERDAVHLERDGVWTDISEFQEKLAACQGDDTVNSDCLDPLTEATDLYRDDFMAGFTLPDSPDFDDWQFFQGEEYRQALSSTLDRLIQTYSTQGDYELALPFARRRLALDPLHEPAHRDLMRLYALTDQRSAALRQYQVAVQTLEEELGTAPMPETTNLFERIRTDSYGKQATNKAIEADSVRLATTGKALSELHNIPVPSTPFVGRENKLAEISQLLHDPSCRLLTLIGPGGIGKTRLAIQAAQQVVDEPADKMLFRDGVYFVRLVSIQNTDELIPSIGNAIGLPIDQDNDPKSSLFGLVQDKEMLLVLDNIEHLLTPSVSLSADAMIEDAAYADSVANQVTEILRIAPGVKILGTSREALNVQDEWIYPVEAMRFPTEEVMNSAVATIDLTAYSAVQLFMQSARRVQPDFSLAADQDCVLTICRLVEGIPLAIELAAAWMKAMPCAEIAEEIDQSLDFLTTSLRDVPTRHRSLRAVFEQSWRLLSEQERAVFRRLSVFRGGFRKQAAKQIAGASLLDLAVMVEKSLLKVTPAGRYRMHELLRQFAAEKLAESPREEAETKSRHSDYFIAFVNEREPLLNSDQQSAAINEIGQETKNIIKAFDRAADQDPGEASQLPANSLSDVVVKILNEDELSDNERT